MMNITTKDMCSESCSGSMGYITPSRTALLTTTPPRARRDVWETSDSCTGQPAERALFPDLAHSHIAPSALEILLHTTTPELDRMRCPTHEKRSSVSTLHTRQGTSTVDVIGNCTNNISDNRKDDSEDDGQVIVMDDEEEDLNDDAEETTTVAQNTMKGSGAIDAGTSSSAFTVSYVARGVAAKQDELRRGGSRDVATSSALHNLHIDYTTPLLPATTNSSSITATDNKNQYSSSRNSNSIIFTNEYHDDDDGSATTDDARNDTRSISSSRAIDETPPHRDRCTAVEPSTLLFLSPRFRVSSNTLLPNHLPSPTAMACASTSIAHTKAASTSSSSAFTGSVPWTNEKKLRVNDTIARAFSGHATNMKATYAAYAALFDEATDASDSVSVAREVNDGEDEEEEEDVSEQTPCVQARSATDPVLIATAEERVQSGNRHVLFSNVNSNSNKADVSADWERQETKREVMRERPDSSQTLYASATVTRGSEAAATRVRQEQSRSRHEREVAHIRAQMIKFSEGMSLMEKTLRARDSTVARLQCALKNSRLLSSKLHNAQSHQEQQEQQQKERDDLRESLARTQTALQQQTDELRRRMPRMRVLEAEHNETRAMLRRLRVGLVAALAKQSDEAASLTAALAQLHSCGQLLSAAHTRDVARRSSSASASSSSSVTRGPSHESNKKMMTNERGAQASLSQDDASAAEYDGESSQNGNGGGADFDRHESKDVSDDDVRRDATERRRQSDCHASSLLALSVVAGQCKDEARQIQRDAAACQENHNCSSDVGEVKVQANGESRSVSELLARWLQRENAALRRARQVEHTTHVLRQSLLLWAKRESARQREEQKVRLQQQIETAKCRRMLCCTGSEEKHLTQRRCEKRVHGAHAHDRKGKYKEEGEEEDLRQQHHQSNERHTCRDDPIERPESVLGHVDTKNMPNNNTSHQWMKPTLNIHRDGSTHNVHCSNNSSMADKSVLLSAHSDTASIVVADDSLPTDVSVNTTPPHTVETVWAELLRCRAELVDVESRHARQTDELHARLEAAELSQARTQRQLKGMYAAADRSAAVANLHQQQTTRLQQCIRQGFRRAWRRGLLGKPFRRSPAWRRQRHATSVGAGSQIVSDRSACHVMMAASPEPTTYVKGGQASPVIWYDSIPTHGTGSGNSASSPADRLPPSARGSGFRATPWQPAGAVERAGVSAAACRPPPVAPSTASSVHTSMLCGVPSRLTDVARNDTEHSRCCYPGDTMRSRGHLHPSFPHNYHSGSSSVHRANLCNSHPVTRSSHGCPNRDGEINRTASLATTVAAAGVNRSAANAARSRVGSPVPNRPQYSHQRRATRAISVAQLPCNARSCSHTAQTIQAKCDMYHHVGQGSLMRSTTDANSFAAAASFRRSVSRVVSCKPARCVSATVLPNGPDAEPEEEGGGSPGLSCSAGRGEVDGSGTPAPPPVLHGVSCSRG